MKLFFAYLSIALLILSGIRAPEARETSRGICLSGALLEKAAHKVLAREKATDISQDTQEFRKVASNPLLIHSGFAPSAHPFDFPISPNLSAAAISDFLISRNASDLGSNILFPHERPPIVFFS